MHAPFDAPLAGTVAGLAALPSAQGAIHNVSNLTGDLRGVTG